MMSSKELSRDELGSTWRGGWDLMAKAESSSWNSAHGTCRVWGDTAGVTAPFTFSIHGTGSTATGKICETASVSNTWPVMIDRQTTSMHAPRDADQSTTVFLSRLGNAKPPNERSGA